MGLYVSSFSSCMGSLYGSARILQCIAGDEVIPPLRLLSKGVRAQVLLCALCVFSSVSSFVFCLFALIVLREESRQLLLDLLWTRPLL